MPEYLRPGVYIEEIERGPRPIEGVPTSTAAFLGAAERGPVRPRLVTSYREYERNFGAVFDPQAYMPYAVSGFFENGGTNLYVCRLVGPSAVAASADAGDFTILAAGPGVWGNQVYVKIGPSTTKNAKNQPVGFSVSAAYFPSGATPADPGTNPQPPPSVIELYDDLVTDERSPDFYGKRLNFVDLAKGPQNQGPDASGLITLVRKAAPSGPNTAPNPIGQALAGGADDPEGVVLTVVDYVGDVPASPPVNGRTEFQGLTALLLDPYRDVALVYAPNVSSDVVQQIITHCENQRFRFAVVDCPRGQNNTGSLDPRTNLPTDTQYAAFYYPWIFVSDPATGAKKLVPPGGATLGLYARTDSDRGVFKSPANDTLRGALALEYDISDDDQKTLNPRGVNAIRSFAGRGILVWGARTLTSNSLWKYVSVRRLFIFLERSIYEGTQWVVFEPNDPRLWARVTDTIRLFLRGQWRAGALFGRREQDAFFITCDETVMTQDDILNGRLVCEIGIAPVRPAEFVIFRIFQNTAEAQT
jgi:phage tail sheath protein FI